MKAFLIGLSKVLLKAALDESLKQALPNVYKQLDAEIPLLLYNNAPPASVRGAVGSAIANVTGTKASPEQIKTVLGLYDPVQAALNRIH